MKMKIRFCSTNKPFCAGSENDLRVTFYFLRLPYHSDCWKWTATYEQNRSKSYSIWSLLRFQVSSSQIPPANLLSCWATHRCLLLMWFILCAWLRPQHRSCDTTLWHLIGCRKGHSQSREDESAEFWVRLILKQKKKTMKVNDFKGRTVSTVNRKLCVLCGMSRDGKIYTNTRTGTHCFPGWTLMTMSQQKCLW